MNINDNFRYLHIGLPNDVLRRKLHGDFEGAVAAIDRHLASPTTPETLKRCLTVQREMILRLPLDYPYTKEEALALVREHIPDFTEAEFDALEDQWKIDWIYDHGVPHYFDRFFETLCKTNAAFAARASVRTSGADGQDPEGRLDRVADRLRTAGTAASRVRCRATVQMKDEVFEAGRRVRAYLPLPCACDAQSDIRIERVSPEPTHISPEDAPQRVIFWEEVMEENHPFEVEFSFTQTQRYHDLTRPETAPGAPKLPEDAQRWLGEEAPHILFTPYLRELARTLTQGADTNLEKARRIYDFITQNASYNFMPAYFSLENIAENCARSRTGDCGVFALLFITLCRCAGVPARWQSGWKVEPGFCGAHDWAQFYAAPYGWLYADPSFGVGAVRENNEERRLHYFGNLDTFRMVANTQFQGDFDVPKDHWRADPYDNQVGEMETEDRGLRYEEFLRTKEVLEYTEL